MCKQLPGIMLCIIFITAVRLKYQASVEPVRPLRPVFYLSFLRPKCQGLLLNCFALWWRAPPRPIAGLLIKCRACPRRFTRAGCELFNRILTSSAHTLYLSPRQKPPLCIQRAAPLTDSFCGEPSTCWIRNEKCIVCMDERRVRWGQSPALLHSRAENQSNGAAAGAHWASLSFG